MKMIKGLFYKIKYNKNFNHFNKILLNFYKCKVITFMIKQMDKWENKQNKKKLMKALFFNKNRYIYLIKNYIH